MSARLDADACHRALSARDRRFDGLWFVAVTSTGIYCRPICPARTPRRDRCAFFGRAAEAEEAGFRPCLRCRPERAPGGASVDALSVTVARAVRRIDAGALHERSVETLADSLGVTSRHLRRSMQHELGTTPSGLETTRRLALSRQLLRDTPLPIAQIAFASGFASVRRFNDAFRDRFRDTPASLRRVGRDIDDGAFTLRLTYRPPFDWTAMMRFLDARATLGVEQVYGDAYLRTLAIEYISGWVRVSDDSQKHALVVALSPSLAPVCSAVVPKLRALFDLDARPTEIADALSADARLARSIVARPGLRVPGAVDGFELAMRAIVGQQVSVRGATTTMGKLVRAFGAPCPTPHPALTHVAPSAERIVSIGETSLAAIGVVGARARAIVAVARAVTESRLSLEPHDDADRARATLTAIAGIGPWTAEYIAMRALRDPDAFPASDLVLMRKLGVTSARALEAHADRWRPWRAYAALYIWNEEAQR